MATDKKSDYVGNHGGAYTDIDGMSRQFTTIDHDKKTTISMFTSSDVEDLKKYRADIIKRITDLPASICPSIFTDYTIKGDRDNIDWNIDMLLDEGVPMNQLRDLLTLLENKADIMRLTR